MRISANSARKNKSGPLFARASMRGGRAFFSLLIALTTALGMVIIVRATGPLLTATMTDNIINDGIPLGDGADGKADPGEIIEYTTTIANTDAGVDATGVSFSDVIDLKTTLVGGSIDVSPLAGDNNYDAIGNTLLEVGVTPSGNTAVPVSGNLFDNDTEFLSDTFTLKSVEGSSGAAPLTSATESGGSVTVQADGTFSYMSPLGFSGADHFDYVITDDGIDGTPGNADDMTGAGRVTINVSHRVWYVKNNAPAGGQGRATDPFDTLAEAQTASSAGDTIYIFSGDGTTLNQNSGVVLKDSQRLIGQGVALTIPITSGSFNGTPAPTTLTLRTAGTEPKIGNSGGFGVSVPDISNVEIFGLNIAGSTNAVNVATTASNSGGFELANNTISAAGTNGVDVNSGGSGALTASIHDNTITATGNGINILRASGGGSVNITAFNDNTISGTTGGIGINIVGTGGTILFDSNPGTATYDAISGGDTVVGSSGAGNGTGGAGVILNNIKGDLSFTDLDIYTDSGAALTVAGTTPSFLASGSGTRITANVGNPTLAAIGGAALDVTDANINIVPVTFTSSITTATRGVSLLRVSGTLTAPSGSTITSTNASGAGFFVDGGSNINANVNVTYPGTITADIGRLVQIQNVTPTVAASYVFSGAITDNNDGDGNEQGISLTGNSNGTITFSGGLSIRTTSNAAFTATGGGTVNVCDENPCNPGATGSAVNTLTSTTGTALNVANTNIGSNNLEFKSISANGAANGIVLNTTGSSGGLIVKGDGSATRNATGGTIQNITNIGVSLTSTNNVSLSHMTIDLTTHHGIKGTLVNNFTFNHGTINHSGINGGGAVVGTTNDSNISFGLPASPSGSEQNLSGAVSIVNNALSNAYYYGIDIEQFNGTISSATITNNALASTGSASTSVGTAINVILSGGAGFASSLTQADISNNTIGSFPSAAGLQLYGGNINGTTQANLGIHGSGTNIINIATNNFNGVFGTTAIDFEVHGAGDGNFNIHDNPHIDNTTGSGMIIDVGRGCGSSGTGACGGNVANVTGKILNNALNTNNGLTSPGISIGLSNLTGSENTNAPLLTLNVIGNVITNNSGVGILANSIRNAGTMHVTIQNNSVSAPTAAGNRAGIEVRSAGPLASTIGNTTVCANILGNTVTGSGTFPGIGLRLQSSPSAGQSIAFGINGLTGGGGSPATEQFVGNTPATGKNPGTMNGSLGTAGVVLESATSGFTNCSTQLAMMTPSQDSLANVQLDQNNVQNLTTLANSVNASMAAFIPVNLSKQVSAINSHAAIISAAAIADGSGKPLFSIAQPAPAQSGETVGPISIGTLPATKSVTIKYRVQVDAPITTTRLLNQGTVSGSNFSPNVDTTDPSPNADAACTGTTPKTCTPTDRPNTTITSINRDATSPTNTGTVSWTVTFADPISGLDVSNLTLVNTGLGGSPAISSVDPLGGTEPDDEWTVTASTGTGDGTLGLNMTSDSLLSNHVTNLPLTGEVYTIDRTLPTTTSFARQTPSASLTSADTLIFRVTFSEDVTLVDTTDFAVNGTTTASVTAVDPVSTGVYDVTISGGNLAGYDGVVGVNFGGSLNINDMAGNALASTEPSTDETYTVDNSAPTVTNVTSTSANGSYAAGAVIPVTVTFSESVTVSGSPQLTLETGATDQIVNYTSGSGTATLIFNYTVQAGDDSADLDYVSTAALDANGGSIQDAILNDATLTLASPGTAGSLGFNKDIVIDNGASTVKNVTSTTTNGSYGAGTVIPITVTFDEAVTVTGTPQLTLETGATDQIVNYTSGSGTATLTFNYTVQAGDSSSDLDYVSTSALGLNGGTIQDAATNDAILTLASPGTTGSVGFNKDIVVDTIAADITNVTSTKADGTYGTGVLIPITITFGEQVLVTGTPQLTLETGATDRTINYTSGSGTDTLTFNYTTQSGDITSDLDYTSASALVLNSGTVKDAASNNAILTLPTPGAAGSLGDNKAIVIDANEPTVTNVTSSTSNSSYKAGAIISVQVTFDRAVNVTGTPQLTLETGTTDQAVNYTSGSGSSTLTFDYTVQAGDTTSDLDYTSTSALTLNSGTIQDASTSMDATLILPTPGGAGSLGANKSIVIDTTSATISNVTSSTANGNYTSGAVISISITYNEIVFITGTPQLTLETGATDQVINYASGSGTNTLTFNYTVQAGDISADLDYKSTTALALNGGTIQDLAMNNATLTLPTPGAAGSLGANKAIVIDNTAPNTTIDGNPSNPTNNTSATFTFSGTDSSGIASYECQLDAGGFSACTSPTNYSGLSAASHTFQVRAIDNVGLADATPASYTWVIDLTNPSVTINLAAGQASSTSVVPINFTVIFSESVTGFTNADVDLTASTTTGTLSAAVTGGPSTYNVAVTGMAGDGNVIASIPAGGATDQASNFNTGSTTSGNTVAYTYDSTPPTVVSSVRANPSPTSAIHVDFTVTFSETVTGVDVSDFSLTTTGGIANALINTVSGSGSVYTITINTGSNNGTIRLNVLNDNTIVDAVLNPLAAGFTSGQAYTIVNKSAIFADVPYSYWANGYVERLYNAGITGGCANSPLIYCPDDKVTRAQMAVFLLRTIHGASFTPPPATGTVFNDVPASYWAAPWIEQFYAEGVTSGCGDGNYCPDAVSTTRAQMAIFLLRGRHGSSYTPPAPTGIFNDVPVDYWAAAWIEQLVMEGITSGCGGGNYCPENSLTRAEMAVFLVKTFNFPKLQE